MKRYSERNESNSEQEDFEKYLSSLSKNRSTGTNQLLSTTALTLQPAILLEFLNRSPEFEVEGKQNDKDKIDLYENVSDFFDFLSKVNDSPEIKQFLNSGKDLFEQCNTLFADKFTHLNESLISLHAGGYTLDPSALEISGVLLGGYVISHIPEAKDKVVQSYHAAKEYYNDLTSGGTHGTEEIKGSIKSYVENCSTGLTHMDLQGAMITLVRSVYYMDQHRDYFREKTIGIKDNLVESVMYQFAKSLELEEFVGIGETGQEIEGSPSETELFYESTPKQLEIKNDTSSNDERYKLTIDSDRSEIKVEYDEKSVLNNYLEKLTEAQSSQVNIESTEQFEGKGTLDRQKNKDEGLDM